MHVVITANELHGCVLTFQKYVPPVVIVNVHTIYKQTLHQERVNYDLM